MNLKKSEPVAADGTEAGAERGELTGKLLLIGGGVVGLVGAGALAFVLLGGGEEPVATSALPTPSASAPAPTETASPSTSASIPTYAAKNARDPFKALVTQAPAAKAAATSSTSATTWSPPPSSVTPTWSSTTRTSTSSSSTTAPPASGADIPYDVNIVVLDKIVDEKTIIIYADEVRYTLTVGEVVDGPFLLKSVDKAAQSATVQYGDVQVTLLLRQVVILQAPTS